MLIDVAIIGEGQTMSDFHCEWAIVATQTMASTDETFWPWGSPYRSSQ